MKENSRMKSNKFDLTKFDWMIAFAMASVMCFAALYLAGLMPWQDYRFNNDVTEGPLDGRVWAEIFHGNIPPYSWNIGLGGSTLLDNSYGGMSPFNILFLIVPDWYVALVLVIIAKTGASALFMQIFLRKGLGFDPFKSLLFSCGYALCSYQIVYFQCLCLNDIVYMLPMLMMVLIFFVRTGKGLLLSVSYAYCFLIQFYCGFVIGVFSFICFAVYLCIYRNEISHKRIIKLIIVYCLSVGAAVFVSMCMLLPVIIPYISGGGSAFNDTDSARVINPMLFIGALFWGRDVVLNEETPCLYCGILAAILAPLYFVNPAIDKKKKMFAGVISFFLILSLVVTPLYEAWHLFNRPDGFTGRFSILLSFMISVLAAGELNQWKDEFKANIKYQSFALVLFAFIPVIYIFWIMSDDRSYGNPVMMLIGNIIFTGFWICHIFLMKNKNKRIGVATYLLMLVELVSAATICFCDPGNVETFTQRNMEEATAAVMVERSEAVEEDCSAGYTNLARTHIHGLISNQGNLLGYPGVSMYSPGHYGAFLDTFYRLGDEISVARLTYNGACDFTDMILGVRYLGRIWEATDTDSKSEVRYSFYKNENALPIGFMVSEDILNKLEFGKDPFVNQNAVASAMCGEKTDIWVKAEQPEIQLINIDMKVADDGVGKIYNTKKDEVGGMIVSVPKYSYSHAFAYFAKSSGGKITVHKSNEKSVDIEMYSEGDRRSTGIRQIDAFISMMEMESWDGENFQFRVADYDTPEAVYNFTGMYVYYQDDDVLNKMHDEMAAGGWKEQVLESDYIKAEIDVENDKDVLFMSIPFDNSWEATIDGMRCDLIPVVGGSFCAIKTGHGKHIVEMRYKVPGRRAGVIIAFVGILIWIIMAIDEKSNCSKEGKIK